MQRAADRRRRAVGRQARGRARRRGCGCAPRCWPAPGRRSSPARPTSPSASASAATGAERRRRSSELGTLTLRLRGRAASSAGRGDGADQRRRAAAPSRRRGRRFGAALTPLTVNLLPGQDVLTVSEHAGQDRGADCAASAAASFPSRWRASTSPPAGCVVKAVQRAAADGARRLCLAPAGAARGRRAQGRAWASALHWWLEQLESPTTRQALLERHGRPRIAERAA